MVSLIRTEVCITIVICILSHPRPVIAQDPDSIKSSPVDEFVIQSEKAPDWKQVTRFDSRIIDRQDGSSIADLGTVIPSAKMHTNSRGESTLLVRGASERQILFFFDGVLLNVPWDNRVDLSQIPSEAVSGMTVTRGIPSVIYGANALSGVVNIFSKPHADTYAKFVSRFGDNNSRYFSGIYSGGGDGLSYLFSSSYRTTDGFNLPRSLHYPNNPANRRLNSGNTSMNVFSKLTYRYAKTGSIGLTTSFVNSRKQVPPEIGVSTPRYWRYPLWQRFSLGLNGEHAFDGASTSKLEYSLSGLYLNSQINQYNDDTFTDIDDIEKSNDFVYNGRIVYSEMIRSTSLLKIALAGYSTRHLEEIQSERSIRKSYTQYVLSAGLEYEYFWKNVTTLTGVSYDYSYVISEGNRMLNNTIQDYSLTFGIEYLIGSFNTVNLSVGRKTRFPTLRESFSGALGRFVPNPALKPETAYSFDAGLINVYGSWNFDMIFFITYLHDGIVRESLPDRQFRRVNKDVIRTYGLELSSQYELNDNLSSFIQITYLSAMARDDAGAFRDTLEYKPKVIAAGQLNYTPVNKFETMLEVRYAGKEFGLREGNPYFQHLPDFFLLNIRLTYVIELSPDLKLELFGRINNIFDRLYYSQWGLPEAGRNYRGGLSVEF